METEPEIVAPKPKKRKKAKPVKRAPRVVEAKPAAGELDGISATDCPFDCGPDGCIITGNVCGHPNKGGLQSMHQSKPDVIRKFNQARKILAHVKVDNRG